MLCEKCKKNSATIFYQQIVNGEKQEFHLCEECAAKMQSTVSFDSMFKGFLDSFINMGNIGYTTKAAFSCPSCKMSFEDLAAWCPADTLCEQERSVFRTIRTKDRS